MNDHLSFGKQLKAFREKHFPGKSLRVASEELKFGDTFFTYLSKMENDTLLPSEAVFAKLVEAFRLTKEEERELLTAYLAEKINQSELIKAPLSPQTAGLLFRKIKTDKSK